MCSNAERNLHDFDQTHQIQTLKIYLRHHMEKIVYKFDEIPMRKLIIHEKEKKKLPHLFTSFCFLLKVQNTSQIPAGQNLFSSKRCSNVIFLTLNRFLSAGILNYLT